MSNEYKIQPEVKNQGFISGFFDCSSQENNDSFSGTQEETLSRKLKPRAVLLLILGSAIGTDLIIGSGSSLARGGPISLFLAYLFTGSLLAVDIFLLSVNVSFSPTDKEFSGYLTRYVNPALGFAAGWNYFF